MRTGAIFARGSCRALAWVLALGVAAVLSAGEAVAQTTVIIPDTLELPSSLSLDEAGDGKNITIKLKTKRYVYGAEGNNPDSETPAGLDAVVIGVGLSRDPADDGAEFEVDNEAPAAEQNTDDLDTSAVSSLWPFTHTWTFDLSAETEPRTIEAPANSVLTVSALEDGGATDGRNVLVFGSTWSVDSNGTGAEGGVVRFTRGRVTITETDKNTTGVIVSKDTLTLNEGDSDTYTVKLGSQPTDDVTVAVKVTKLVDANITVDKASLTFTSGATGNWGMAQTVTVTAGTDRNTENGSATITNKATSDDVDYNDVSGDSVEVHEVDSVRTVTLTTSADTVDEGKTITITATLENPEDDISAILSDDVVIKLSGDDTKKFTGTAEITIPANSTAGSTKLTAKHDADETDADVTLTATVSTGPGGIIEIDDNKVKFKIVDDDEYTLESSANEVAEGKEVMLTVELNANAALETKVMIDLYQASGATVKVAEGQDADPDDNTIAIMDEGEKTAKFTLKAGSDADSDDETIIVRAMAAGKVVGNRVTINVLDDEARAEFTFTLEPTFIGEADGEQSVMLMAMTNKAVTADTMVKFAVEDDSTAMNPDDYTIMPESGMIELTVEKGMTSAMTEFMVTPVMDSMDEPNETIKLSGWIDADDDAETFELMVGNYANLTIIDGDSPGSGITPKSAEDVAKVFSDAIEMAGGLMVGGNMVKVDMSMLFNMANPDMEVMYTASSSDEAVLMVSTDDSMLMLDPMMMGMSTVCVMAEPAAGGSGASAVAVVSCSGAGASVTVNLQVMGAITFMLTGPEDMNLVEGMSAKVMVTASSAVAADTEVSLMRDGTSTASMDDYTVEPMMATIMAGETMAEFEVMAVEDDMMESEGNMAEMLTLFLVVDDMQMTDQSVSFYLWDAAVPALPVIAQLLLAAFLALGGYRRYLRR